MSIQDDIYDLQYAVKRKPEAKIALDNVLNSLYKLEAEVEEHRKIYSGLGEVDRAIQNLKERIRDNDRT